MSAQNFSSPTSPQFTPLPLFMPHHYLKLIQPPGCFSFPWSLHSHLHPATSMGFPKQRSSHSQPCLQPSQLSMCRKSWAWLKLPAHPLIYAALPGSPGSSLEFPFFRQTLSCHISFPAQLDLDLDLEGRDCGFSTIPSLQSLHSGPQHGSQVQLLNTVLTIRQ